MNLLFALKSVHKTNLVPYFEPSSCICVKEPPPTNPPKTKLNRHVPNGHLPLAPPSKNSKNLYLNPTPTLPKRKEKKRKTFYTHPPTKNTHS